MRLPPLNVEIIFNYDAPSIKWQLIYNLITYYYNNPEYPYAYKIQTRARPEISGLQTLSNSLHQNYVDTMTLIRVKFDKDISKYGFLPFDSNNESSILYFLMIAHYVYHQGIDNTLNLPKIQRLAPNRRFLAGQITQNNTYFHDLIVNELHPNKSFIHALINLSYTNKINIDWNAKEGRGESVFHLLLHMPHYYNNNAVLQLINCGRGHPLLIDFNDQANNGRCPLHTAALAGNVEAFQALLKHNVNNGSYLDTERKDRYGHTAWDYLFMKTESLKEFIEDFYQEISIEPYRSTNATQNSDETSGNSILLGFDYLQAIATKLGLTWDRGCQDFNLIKGRINYYRLCPISFPILEAAISDHKAFLKNPQLHPPVFLTERDIEDDEDPRALTADELTDIEEMLAQLNKKTIFQATIEGINQLKKIYSDKNPNLKPSKQRSAMPLLFPDNLIMEFYPHPEQLFKRAATEDSESEPPAKKQRLL